MKNYHRVNNDELKTKEKCIAMCRQILAENKSVVIDNTNPTAAVRERFTVLAKAANVPVRCFVFSTDKARCTHNNDQRWTNTERVHISGYVPALAIYIFFKNFKAPELSEGFESIHQIEFVADNF